MDYAEYEALARPLMHQGIALLREYASTEDTRCLDESIELARKALSFPVSFPRPEYLNTLAIGLAQRFQDRRDIQDLSEAIQSLEEAASNPQNPSQHSTILQNLASLLGDRYEMDGESSDFDRAVSCGQDALSTSSSDTSRALCLHTLSKLHHYHYSRECHLRDLEIALQMGQKALEVTPQDHPKREMYLGRLGTLHLDRFHRLWDPNDIEIAIQYASEAMELSASLEDYTVCCMNLSNAFGSRFESTEETEDLKSAIEFADESVQNTSSDNPHLLADRCHNLSTLLGDRFDRFKDPADLEQAIELEQSAVNATKHDNVKMVTSLDHLGELLARKSNFQGGIGCLNRAIELAYDVLNCTCDQSDASRANYFSHLADRFATRFGRMENIEDLDNAIAMKKRALKALPDVDLRCIEFSMDLSDYLHNRYIILGSSEDLTMAVQWTQGMLDEGLAENLSRQSDLCTLSRRFCDRYEITGLLEDIQASIRIAEKAVGLAPSDHPLRPYSLLQLSNALESNFNALGSLEHLEKAIEASKEAVDAVSPDHPDQALFLYILSNQLLHRYEQTGAIVDLKLSLDLMQESNRKISLDDPAQIACFHALSVRLGHLYDRSHDVQRLSEAIGFSKKALELAPGHGMTRAAILNGLGMLLESRFTATQLPEDLQDMVATHREALQTIPEDHPERDCFLGSLADAMKTSFQQTFDSSHLMEAVQLRLKALSTKPTHHPNRAMHLNELGKILIKDKALAQAFAHEFESPLDIFVEALNHRNSPPIDRIRAGQNAFESYTTLNEWENAVRIATETMKLFPLLVPRWLSRDDQQHLLKNVSRFTSQAASAVLHSSGTPEEALVILEAGRGVIAGLSMELKTDISKLQEHQPLLYFEYTQLRRQILLNFSSPSSHLFGNLKLASGSKNTPIISPGFLNTGIDRTENLRKLQALESSIRNIQGFEQFLTPPSPAIYMKLAEMGPIVSFNTTEMRSDAILVTHTQIESILLPNLHFHTMKASVQKVIGKERLSRGLSSTKSQRNQELRTIMEWIWEVAVEPILRRLGLYQEKRPIGPLPRIWWVSSGYMGILPLHAAGSTTANAMNLVISSYTPTFQALKFSRDRRKLASHERGLKILIVPAPEKIGRKPLDTATEIESIKQCLQANTSPTILHEPLCDIVLQQLPAHDLIHFSCHGSSNLMDPSNSALELSSHNGDKEPSLLTVRDIAALDHDRARIAYLSACSTAENSSEELLDENIHIASAFQLAGFPHVIGSLWEVSDKAAVGISRRFYQILGQQIGEGGPHNDVAYALHASIQDLMHKKPRDVLSWTPFVYMGA